MKHINLTIDAQLLAGVIARCKLEGLTLSGLIRRLLRAWLETESKEN